MRNRSLQEIAKFAAGLVAADFLWLLWFSQQHLRSAQFLGMTITPDTVLPSMIFDIAVFLVLVHYSWNIGKIPAVREHTYIVVVGVLFAVIAIAHLYRIFTGTDIEIEGLSVPIWLSYIGVSLTAYLAYMSFHLSTRMKR